MKIERRIREQQERMKREYEQEIIRRKEKEEWERSKLREKLGKCANGNWVNVGYYKTLLGMGYTKKVKDKRIKSCFDVQRQLF